MSKRRSHQGPEGSRAGRESSKTPASRHELDEQAELGNAAIQARMVTQELPGQSELSPSVQLAINHVDHALAALHLDPAEPARVERLVAILEGSNLAERDTLVDRLHAAETSRQVVDAALVRWFGSADHETRWAVDAALATVRAALDDQQVEPVDGAGSDAPWSILEGAGAQATALEGLATAPVAQAVVGFCRTLALAVMLDEEEEEEIDLDPAIGLDA